ncbi:serine hydrolase domain-containing protein, partial [Microbacterium sp.]|uniref:serine hydrolase domain-containing protein n=1 Tax=Microbacterium sp. TaxID=51671 RepID=UPI003C715932
MTLPSQVDAPLPDETQVQLQAAVERAVAASGSSGAAVGAWAPWSGSWLAGVGTVLPQGAATPADATFKIGAVTRAMTCDVLYGLVADGVVELGDQVGDYVPGLAGNEVAPDATTTGAAPAGEITLGQLCDSTGGLSSYAPLIEARLRAAPTRSWNPRELLAYGLSRGVATTPGTTFADSDTGYVLLGVALERASGKTAAALYEQYVFDPVGMPASALPTAADVELGGLWSGDAEDGSVACAAPLDMTALSPSAGFTASGVTSDLTDIGRYVQALAVGARSYDTDKRFDAPLPVWAGGPSWFTASGGAYQAGSLIGQYGSLPGYLTAAFADRSTGMTVVVALNNSRASADLVRSLAWELAAIASKAPAASGQTLPEAGLPWTAEDMA